MTRNLKALGLTFMAAMALGAIGAQGASAAEEHSFRLGSDSTVLTGQNESYTSVGSKWAWEFTPGLWVKCDMTFEGTNPEAIRDIVTVHPKFHNCTSSLGGAPTVHTSGCNFIFGSDTTEDASHLPGTEHATWSLECESPESASPHKIEITAPGCNFAIETTHTSPSVTVDHNLHGVRYTQVTHSGIHALTLVATVRTIKFTTTAGSLCGLAGHAPGTYGSGRLDGTATVTGYEISSEPTGSTTEGTTYNHGQQVSLTVSTPE